MNRTSLVARFFLNTNVDQFFLLEGVHIAGNVQVKLIGLDFLERCHMCKALYIYTLGVGAENVIDMVLIQFVLVFVLAISQVSVCILRTGSQEDQLQRPADFSQ